MMVRQLTQCFVMARFKRAIHHCHSWVARMKRAMTVLGGVAMLAMLVTVPIFAVQPDEILADPALEARARNLSTELRCLVCQNQSIDESDAPLARDLRLLIREQLVQKKSDAEIMDFLVARYGDYVRLRPPFRGSTLVLWLLPFLLLAGAMIVFVRRGKTNPPAETPLSQPEAQRLESILGHADGAKKP